MGSCYFAIGLHPRIVSPRHLLREQRRFALDSHGGRSETRPQRRGGRRCRPTWPAVPQERSAAGPLLGALIAGDPIHGPRGLVRHARSTKPLDVTLNQVWILDVEEPLACEAAAKLRFAYQQFSHCDRQVFLMLQVSKSRDAVCESPKMRIGHARGFVRVLGG